MDLQVIPIGGIKISAPLMRVQEGATIPAWATGLPEQLSPLILGSIEPPISFDWSLDDTGVAEIGTAFQPLGKYFIYLHDLQSVFKPLLLQGIQYNTTDQVAIRIRGVTPGRTKLNLKASVPGFATAQQKKAFVIFTSSIEIEVFEKLQLIVPKINSPSSILMPPYSKLQLKTNLDGVVKVLYR